MAPIIKDFENPAATPAPAAPTTKPPQDSSATRPQPVALEVPVTVNGARTVEGSDKREPFSESTKTVLVFGNGAVIRLASLVAPGQLLFVTNEKSKKEVVCQVVKSKNYRTVTGYVELEFTEPAAGFWGMRFPAERTIAPPATCAPAAVPVAPTPAKPLVSSFAPSTLAPPKAVAPALPPTVVKPPAPTAVGLTPLASTPPVVPPAPKPIAPAERNAPTMIAKPLIAVTPAAQGIPPQPVVPTPPVSAKPESTPLPEVLPAAIAPALEAFSQVEVKSVTTEIAKSGPTTTPPRPATEDLKQHAARLQEQLSSLLFTEAPASKQSSPEPAVTPKQDGIPSKTVQKILPLAQPDVKPASPLHVPVQESKPAPPKPAPVSMAVEEVKIPAWLAPLARETDATSAEEAAELAAVSEANSSFKTIPEAALAADTDLSSSKVEHRMFGGQLLGASSTSSEAHPSGSSKTGLWIGIAATVLLVAGGAWYVAQSGTPQMASKPASTQTAQNSNAASNQPAFRPESDAPSGKTATSPGQPTAAKPLTPAPVPAVNSAVSSAPDPAVVKEITSAPRSAPPVEQPKKSVLGDVRLATPNVNRGANSPEGSEGAPSIDAGQPSSSEPLVSLAGAHSKEPIAPLPIGGDVQPAKLLKSVPPIYPPTARTQRVAGDVKIDALIDASGNVSSMKVISGPTLLHQAAMTALKQWKYEPAKLDGNPTQMHLTVTVQFRLQ
jgi:periplasmic protein TonB